MENKYRKIEVRLYGQKTKDMTPKITLEEIIEVHARVGMPPVCEYYLSTGLKDKKGTEIFEGDILNFNCSCGAVECRETQKMTVVWDDACMKLMDEKGEMNYMLNAVNRDCEVIGNTRNAPSLVFGSKETDNSEYHL